MAGFQAVGITPSSYPATQQTSHHFHPHHLHHHLHQHQQQPHRSSPPSTDCLAASSPCASSPVSASGPAASSATKPRSFSAVGAPSEDFHQQTTLASSSTRRRHSEDSSTSSRLRSEWVTLSKAMLMVLVEKICQLSFENDAQTTPTPMPGVESATLRPLAATDATSKQANTGASDERSNARSGSVTTSDADGSPFLVDAAVAFSDAPSGDRNLAPTFAPPARTLAVAHSHAPAPVPAPASHPKDDSVRAAAAAAAPIDASIEKDVENTSTSAAAAAHDLGATTIPIDAATEPSASWESASGSVNRKRGSRRAHAKPARGGGGGGGRRRGAGKTGDADVVERMEDRLRGIKMRPLRQRNCDRTVQPWVACNKSLVYSMIDSALGATDSTTPAGARKVVVTSPVACQTGVRSGARCRAAHGAKDVGTRTSSAVDLRGHAEGPRRPTGSPDATCEAPLLGALLSYDDTGVTKSPRDIPGLPPPPPRRRQHPLRRSSPVQAILPIGSTWHRASSEELRVPSPLCQNLICGGLVQIADNAFAASPCSSAQGRDAENLASSRSAARNTPRSPTGFSGKSSRSTHQTGSGSNRLRQSKSLLSDLDPGMLESRRTKTGAKTTVGPDVERPRWIALDKDEVRLLVDSLVSTMMTPDDDVTHDSAARCRSFASPSNPACNNDNYRYLSDNNGCRPGNEETGCQQLIVTNTTSGRHDNREDNWRLVATDSDRHDDDETTIEYGRILEMDVGRHGNGRHDDGKRGCWRSRAVQCLSTDDARGSKDYPSDPGSVVRDNGGECSVARGVSEGLARSTMKWKSSMLLRLSSQSQDEEK